MSYARIAAISVVEIPSMTEVVRFEDGSRRGGGLPGSPVGPAVSVGGSEAGDRFSGLFPTQDGGRVAHVWDAATPKVPMFERWSTRDEPIQESLLTADGATAILVYADRAELVTLATGASRAVPGDYGDLVAVSSDGRYLAAVASLATQSGLAQRNVLLPHAVVTVHDLATGAPLPALSASADVTSLAFAPTGHVLAVGTDDGTEIWNLPEGQRLAGLSGQAAATGGVAVDPTGRQAYSVSLDGTVVRWDVDGHQLDLPAPRPADRGCRPSGGAA